MGRFDALTTLDQKPVQPTPLLENGEEVPPASKPAKKQTSKEVSLFVSKPVNQQASKEVSQQAGKEASQQTSKPVNQQASKLVKKFSSYLAEESLRGLKRIAFETDRKDYEVLQEAVDQYLKKNR